MDTNVHTPKRRSNGQLAMFAAIGLALGVLLTPTVMILYYSFVIAWNLGGLATIMLFGIPLLILLFFSVLDYLSNPSAKSNSIEPAKYTWHGFAAGLIGFAFGFGGRMLFRYFDSKGGL